MMYETIQSRINKFHMFASRRMYEQCREQAEALIQIKPEEPIGYLLMAQYSYFVQIHEDVLTWCEEALLRGPEDLRVLVTVTALHQSIQCDKEKRMELVETGLRLYPYHEFFHIHYAILHEGVDNEQAKASYEEAIRLNPHHEQYLGWYATFLHDIGQSKEAEQLEKLALQEDPENEQNLFRFAIKAYENRKYQKAQMLMEKAISQNPNSYWMREYYKEIYPSKNKIVRAKLQLDHALLKIWKYPSEILRKLLFEKIPLEYCMLFVLILGFVGMMSLFGVYTLIAATGYILLLIISVIISNSMLHAVGITDEEEIKMKRKVKSTQLAALKKMQKQVANSKKNPKEKQETSIPRDALEVQLAKVWDSDSIAAFKEQALTQDDTEARKRSSHTNNQPVPIDWPKDHSNWPFYVIGIVMIIMAAFRFIPSTTTETVSKPTEKVTLEDLEEKQSELKELTEAVENQVSITSDLDQSTINQFLQAVKEDNLEESLPDLIAEDYRPIIQQNLTSPLFKELAEARVVMVHQSIATTYFLVKNEQENSKTVVEVLLGEIMHIYAEKWDESEKEEFHRLVEEIESNGKAVVE